MHNRISAILIAFVGLCSLTTSGYAQNVSTDDSSKPVILYSGTPKKYEIGGIEVTGVKNYEDYVLIGLSGLSVGQTITGCNSCYVRAVAIILKIGMSALVVVDL